MNQQINLDMQICSASSKQDPMHNLEAKVKSRFADFGICSSDNLYQVYRLWTKKIA
jgi:hypothetical protein